MLKIKFQGIIFFCTLFLSLIGFSCQANNLRLIEKRLQELDTLNKQAVKHATKIPVSGIIEATLDIPSSHNVEKLAVKKISITHFNVNSPFTIEITSGFQKQRILDIVKQLRKAEFPAYVSTSFFTKGKEWWRILVGSYSTKIAAEKENQSLEAKNLPKGIVVNMPFAIQVEDDMTITESEFLKKNLKNLGYFPYTCPGTLQNSIKVLIGAFKTKIETQSAVQAIAAQNFKTTVIER